MNTAQALPWLVAAAALAPAPAAAHWEFTRWGMSLQQVVAASRGSVRAMPAEEQRRVPAARMEYRAAGEFRSGTLRLSVAFAFDGRNGGLVCVSARGDAAQGPALRARLMRLFGEPQERGRDPVTSTDSYGWTQPDEIDLQITPGRPVVLLHCARGV
ncbi:hypothetical protein GXW74_05725 [Roseomonas eburnea]|uniref:Uncharacterized protein n=1 Tax=Neoroseomonas eburnea TaxID=1346889 RepID=A0A9X9X8E1_9PROT|nr:hypothetical protein [Neoroseomonas eburnea]MBR0679977.1 hypothetical protein [Neoroseomonas eburnea]